MGVLVNQELVVAAVDGVQQVCLMRPEFSIRRLPEERPKQIEGVTTILRRHRIDLLTVGPGGEVAAGVTESDPQPDSAGGLEPRSTV